MCYTARGHAPIDLGHYRPTPHLAATERDANAEDEVEEPPKELHKVEERDPHLRGEELLCGHRAGGAIQVICGVRKSPKVSTVPPRHRRREMRGEHTFTNLPRPALIVFATSYTDFAPLMTVMHVRYAAAGEKI